MTGIRKQLELILTRFRDGQLQEKEAPPQNLWVPSGAFWAPSPRAPDFQGMAQVSDGPCMMAKDRYASGAWRNGVGLCGDATWRGMFRPMVRPTPARQWCPGSLCSTPSDT